MAGELGVQTALSLRLACTMGGHPVSIKQKGLCFVQNLGLDDLRSMIVTYPLLVCFACNVHIVIISSLAV